MPNWQAESEASMRSKSHSAMAARGRRAFTRALSRLRRTLTKANSAATKNPFKPTRTRAKIILNTSYRQSGILLTSKFFGGKRHHGIDFRGIGEQHHQPVDAQRVAGRRRHVPQLPQE